jgi:hypothetical protein
MSEPTEFQSLGVDEQTLARRRAKQALLESMLANAGIDQEKFDALHQESETAIQARIAQQMAEADAQSAAMRGTVQRDVENWRHTVEYLKTLTATAEPIQRFLLDTASDVTATPGLTLDSTVIAPTNNSAKFFLLSTPPGTDEAVSFGFTWENTSDRSAVVNVDGYLVLDGSCQAIAFGGVTEGFRLCHLFVDAHLNIQELWNQPPTTPIRQAGQDALALQADGSTLRKLLPGTYSEVSTFSIGSLWCLLTEQPGSKSRAIPTLSAAKGRLASIFTKMVGCWLLAC